MTIIPTSIPDLLLIEPQVFRDERGYFVETCNQAKLQAVGLDYTFVQDNQSYSQYGTIRGLHFQTGEYAQAKLVRVIQGKVLDVAVDLRPGSATLGQYVAVELSEDNFRQLLIPRGFAHGFAVLSPTAIFAYKCDNSYHKEAEAGILYSDSSLNIDWQIPLEDQIISAKDQHWPSLTDYLGLSFNPLNQKSQTNGQILVTGANGQLGQSIKAQLNLNQLQTTSQDNIWQEWSQTLQIHSPDQAIFADRSLDITDLSQVEKFFASHSISSIINCAAYTAVDKAETDADTAYAVNTLGAQNLALMSKKYQIPLIHISTDYVFNGLNHIPYLEEDKPSPQSVYGKSKLAGEQAVLEQAHTAYIIRTSWLYSPYGNNFVATMIRLGKEKTSLNVVCDQIGSPTFAPDLAEVILELLAQIQPGQKEIFHYSNQGVASWYDFAYSIMTQLEISCTITPIPSTEYPTPAPRPYYSVLNKAKISQLLTKPIPHWKLSLENYLKTISQEG